MSARPSRTPLRSPPPEADMVGASAPFTALLGTLDRLAPWPHPVLLLGETGTGKELAALRIHRASRRAGGPFVAINCAAIPDGLAESELFGHVRGAFTGAHRTRGGAFTSAHHGTLFLDEVAELPMVLQAKLLRVLETRRIIPLGSDAEVEVDVRIIAATCRNVGDMVAEGKLREDLFHRLGVFPVRLPPLRERPDDIPLLVAHFASHAALELGRPVHVPPHTLAACRQHPWPGNVRALRNAVWRAAALTDRPLEPTDVLPALGPDLPRSRGTVPVPRGTYAAMHRAMLESVIAAEGSLRQAARALRVPRATLSRWLGRLEE